MLSEYELMRLENMRKNEEELIRLGLLDENPQSKIGENKKPTERKRPQEPTERKTRSKRACTFDVDYTIDDIEKKEKKLEKTLKMKKKKALKLNAFTNTRTKREVNTVYDSIQPKVGKEKCHLADAAVADIQSVPGISATSATLIYNIVHENQSITWDELTKQRGIGLGKIFNLRNHFCLDDNMPCTNTRTTELSFDNIADVCDILETEEVLETEEGEDDIQVH